MPSSRRTFASLSSTTRILAFRISVELIMRFRLDSSGLSSRLRRELQRDVQGLHELMNPDGLGEISEEPGLQALFNVARHCVGADGDDGDVCGGRVRSKDPQGVDAADTRQI